MKHIVKREDISEDLKWDPQHIFKTDEEYQLAVQRLCSVSMEMEKEFKGKLNTAESIKKCLDMLHEVYVLMDHTTLYAEMFTAVEQSDTAAQEREGSLSAVLSGVRASLSFVITEILSNPEDVILKAEEECQKYAPFLKELRRQKKHICSPEIERVLARLSGTFMAPDRVYHQIKFGDIRFSDFEVNGTKKTLNFTMMDKIWERDKDTETRRKAFAAFHNTLSAYQSSFAANYNVLVNNEKALSDIHGFKSVFDYLLFSQNVSREVYDCQLDTIMEKLAPHMRRYAEALGKMHHLDKITYADLKLEYDPEYTPTISLDEAKKIIIESLQPMGEDYVDYIRYMLENRGVDYMPNEGKLSDSFCDTPYKKQAGILCNWTGSMRDTLILTHELGHAGHLHLAQAEQSVFTCEPTRYFIEAPSTMNEIILAEYLKKRSKNLREKRWILATMINRTYYHNFVTHFVEAYYQREVYRAVDRGENLNAKKLNTFMLETLRRFWGNSVELLPGSELTWIRQPHYYSGLYSYTYSAGLTIATEVGRRIMSEGHKAVEEWRKVLSSGGSKSPAELASMVGIDITKSYALERTIDYIGSIVNEIIEISKEMGDI